MTENEQELVASLGLGDRVRCAVKPTTMELRSLYSFAHGFIYPSLGEGFGIPILEAMSCGTPTLLSDIPVFREVAEDAALYFDPFDCHDIARCLDALLSSEARDRFSLRGLKTVNKYSWDFCATRVLEVYRRVLRGK